MKERKREMKGPRVLINATQFYKKCKKVRLI